MVSKKIFLALLSCITLVSCSEYHKIVLSGNPGTEIYTTNGNYLTTLDNYGKAKVKIHEGHALLLSKSSNNDYMPFALNRKAGRSLVNNEWFLIPVAFAIPLYPIYPFIVKSDKYVDSYTNEDLIK